MWRETGTKEKKERVLHKEEKNAHLNTGSPKINSPAPPLTVPLRLSIFGYTKTFFFVETYEFSQREEGREK